MNKEEKLKDLCNNCQIHSEYCSIIRCNDYEKIANLPYNDAHLDLYVVSDEKETFIKRFDYGNLIPIKNWIEDFLIRSNIEFEKLCFYNNAESDGEIIVNYGGMMYFVIKEIFEK